MIGTIVAAALWALVAGVLFSSVLGALVAGVRQALWSVALAAPLEVGSPTAKVEPSIRSD